MEALLLERMRKGLLEKNAVTARSTEYTRA